MPLEQAAHVRASCSSHGHDGRQARKCCAWLQDVLQAAEGDINAAAWMLTELHSPVTPGMSPQMSPSMSPWASPLGSPLGSPHVSPARSYVRQPLSSPRPPDLATIAELAGQKARPAFTPRQSPHTPREPQRPVRVSSRVGRGARSEASSISSEHVASAASDTERRRHERTEGEGDAYHSNRGEALQLTRRWQRAAHKATSAFSGAVRGLAVSFCGYAVQLVVFDSGQVSTAHQRAP